MTIFMVKKIPPPQSQPKMISNLFLSITLQYCHLKSPGTFPIYKVMTTEQCYLFHSTDEVLSGLADLSTCSWQATAMCEKSWPWCCMPIHIYRITCFHRTAKLVVQDKIYHKDIKTLKQRETKNISIWNAGSLGQSLNTVMARSYIL